jgi:hypothetical protein
MKAKAIVFAALAAVVVLAGCGSNKAVTKDKAKIVRIESKGSILGIDDPDWVKTYVAGSIKNVQALPDFKDKYCVIGETSSTNKLFALEWADSFNAQQQIGRLIRNTINTRLHAEMEGADAAASGKTLSDADASGEVKREIDNVLNAVVNVSYSGAQRDADWWILNRVYDPDATDEYSDEYTAWVLYTIPKKSTDKQIAAAMETALAKDAELYDITIRVAKDIALKGVEYLAPEEE